MRPRSETSFFGHPRGLFILFLTEMWERFSYYGMRWLVLFTFLVKLGELYPSPVGLSLVTKLAPARIVSMMMGTWFLSSFFGNYAAGFLGHYWERMTKDVFFLMFAAIAFAAGLAILMILRPLKRAIGPEHDM